MAHVRGHDLRPAARTWSGAGDRLGVFASPRIEDRVGDGRVGVGYILGMRASSARPWALLLSTACGSSSATPEVGGDSSSTTNPGSTSASLETGPGEVDTSPGDRDVEPPEGTVLITVDLDTTIAEVSERYLSVAIDSSQVLGGNFWGEGGAQGGLGEERVDPYDFARPRLRALAAELAPAYLRIGGSEADVVYYDLSDQPVEEPPEPYDLVLTATRWEEVVEFAEATGFELFFTINAGPGPRDENDRWTPDNARTLLQHAVDRDDPVGVWELGNEINGYPLFHGLLLSGEDYAADVSTARALVDAVDPDARLAGPSSAYWPVRGEQNPIMPSFMPEGGAALDIVSWHYYPQQSQRCSLPSRPAELTTLLDPENLDEVNLWAQQVEDLAREHAPQAEVWLGESGHAQCGGQPGISDRFVASLWWVDQLGRLARRGHRVSVRQTLSGSDYGLLDEVMLDPRPDYWASVLWKRLMGTKVLAATHDATETLRVYAHCGPEAGGVTVALLNLDRRVAVETSLRVDDGTAEIYTVEAEGLDATQIRLNGEALPSDDGEARAALQPVVSPVTDGYAVVSVPSASYVFAHLPTARARACDG